jgi:quercetin dioxygenase-like cupin family protein
MRLLVIAAILLLSSITGALAQNEAATPPSDTEMAEGAESFDDRGASIEILAAPDGHIADGENQLMVLYRIVLEPGVIIETHDHYDGVIFYVETGTLGFTLESGEAWGMCDGGCVDGDGSAYEPVPLGEEVTFELGDSVVQYDDTAHAYRNAGTDQLVILVTSTYLDEPIEDSATPEPAATPAGPGGIKPQGCRGGCL